MRQILDESAALALSGCAVRCERQYAEHLPGVLGDSGQLAQVFGNLLINARQAMGNEGRIVLCAEAAQDHPDDGGADAGKSVVVRITDSGPGIAPSDLPNMFVPYYTTKPEGTGLGLATSQAIVREHGGTIKVSSVLGEGAMFEVRLPALPQTAASVTSVVPHAIAPASGRILVMDDEPIVRKLVERVLGRAGYRVVVAIGGEQALAEIRRGRAERDAFDLAILDVMVEGGMGGVETLSELRKIEPNLPVILETGYSDRSAFGNVRADGVAHVLSKPFPMHELLSTVKASIDDRRGRVG